MGLEKIPTEKFKQSPADQMWHFGSIVLTTAEIGFAQKLNDIIDAFDDVKEDVRDIKERVIRLEGK